MHVYEYLERVADTLEPFGMDVKHRGPLGNDNADVLFFRENGYGSEVPREARTFLLQDPYIRTLTIYKISILSGLHI